MNDSSAPVRALTRLADLQRFWRWRYGLTCGLPVWLFGCLAAIVVARQGQLALSLPLSVLLLLALALGLFAFALAWHYASLRFAHYRAELHEGEGVVLYSGVWWRSEVWVPTARLQHLDVNQGPLDRRWGMASLSLHTAGSHDHQVSIHGLPLAEAHALREHLLPRQALLHE